MKSYIVTLHEVHAQPVRISAESKTEAMRKVFDGEGDYLDIHNYESFLYTLEEADVEEEE